MTPPKRLKGPAKRKWAELSPCFALADALQIEELAQACEQWALAQAAKVDVEERGIAVELNNGMICTNGSIEVIRKAEIQMGKLLAKLPRSSTKARDWLADRSK